MDQNLGCCLRSVKVLHVYFRIENLKIKEFLFQETQGRKLEK